MEVEGLRCSIQTFAKKNAAELLEESSLEVFEVLLYLTAFLKMTSKHKRGGSINSYYFVLPILSVLNTLRFVT